MRQQQHPLLRYSGADAEQDESLAESFWAVARRLRHLHPRGPRAAGTSTPSQSRALAVLPATATMRLGELAEHLRDRPPLGHRGGRRPGGARPGRALPRPGRPPGHPGAPSRRRQQVAAAIGAAREAEADAFFGTLPAADRQALARILDVLREGG